jgi:hypothetical protein
MGAFIRSDTGSQFYCENGFEGGAWALVRRVKQGNTWHPATDNMKGTSVYGTPGSSSADTTFSVPFTSLVTSNEALVLFASGMV